jgi:hypothetical protein
MKLRVKWLTLAIAISISLVACTINHTPTCQIPETRKTATEFSVNLYLDGTPSMQGFVDAPNTQYIQWINKLQTTLERDSIGFDNRPHTQRQIKYFRLGSKAGTTRQEISADDYGEAETEAFYNGQASKFPLLNVSEIDTAIVPPKTLNELTVVVTDLYQAKDNIGKVGKMVDRYLTSQDVNYAVGIIGIKSEFNGRIYTEGRRTAGEFDYSSQGKADRPFYILCLGQVDDINFYFKELLKNQPIGKTVNAILYSPYRLFEQPVSLTPLTQSSLIEALKSQGIRSKISIPQRSAKFGNVVMTLTDPHIQGLKIQTKSADFSLPSTATWTPIQFTPDLDLTQALQVNMVSQTFDRNQRTFTEESQQTTLEKTLQVSDWQQNDNTLKFTTQFAPQNIRGNGFYSFQAEVLVQPQRGGNAFVDPGDKAWWQDWNSDPSSADGSKTHNLTRLMEELQNVTTNIMQKKPPQIGRLCYVIQKG